MACQVPLNFWSPYKEKIVKQRGAQEMAQVLKHVLYKLEDRSLDPQNPHTCQSGMVIPSVIPAVEGGD